MIGTTLVMGLVLFATASPAQRRMRNNPNQLPPVVDQPTEEPKKTPAINYVDLERKARELADLSASVPYDIEQLKKGLLPKSVPDKLKRIEKLSKELRGTINP
jgi:hypothetical protein